MPTWPDRGWSKRAARESRAEHTSMDDQSTAATTVRVGKLRPGTKLHLPALEVKRERTAIGWIRHVVRGAREAEIEAVREIQVSPRRQDPLCVLDSGESIVVTVRNNVTCPSEAEGVLKLGKDGDSRWLQHSLLDECEKRVEHEGWGLLCQDIARTWDGVFQFRAEKRSATGDIIVPGFRPPQLGALHGIGAHWSQSLRPATVVMPTGTGKTEVVLATLVAYARAPILVVVPSQALREQTVQKFLTLGLLRELGLVPEDVPNPVVGVVTK